MKNVAKIVLGHPNCRVVDELGIEYIYMHVNVCIYSYIHVFFKLPFSKALVENFTKVLCSIVSFPLHLGPAYWNPTFRFRSSPRSTSRILKRSWKGPEFLNGKLKVFSIKLAGLHIFMSSVYLSSFELYTFVAVYMGLMKMCQASYLKFQDLKF